MMHKLVFSIVSTIHICGLSAQVARTAETPGQHQSSQKHGSAAESPNTHPAAFEVPAMWEYSAPLIAPEKRDHDPSRAQKDPTVVFHGGKWHVFMTVKLPRQIGDRVLLVRALGRRRPFAAHDPEGQRQRLLLRPQVFYFSPHQKWYLIYQMGVPGAKKMWVAYSTTANIADPGSWTQAQADPRRRRGGSAQGRRARLLDHLRRPARLSVLDQSERQDVAAVDEAGGFSQGLRPLRTGPGGQDLRGQPHLPAQGAGQVPDDHRGERPAVLQGLPGRPPGRPVDAGGRHGRDSPLPAGRTSDRPRAWSRGPTTSATANSSATDTIRR